MKNKDYYTQKYNKNKLLLVILLRYDGEVFKDYELKKMWTFLSFAIADINEEEKLYNVLNEEETFDNIEAENAEIGDEVVQIVDFASKFLDIDSNFVSKKELSDSMKNSGMYFKDCDESLEKGKKKQKKL